MFRDVTELVVPRGIDVGDVLVAFTRLRRENDLLVAALARECGLHAPDFRALSFVRVTSDVTPRSLAEYLSLSLSATTAMIDRLVAAGYASRSPNPEDGRSVRLELTRQGASAVDRASALYTAAFDASVPAGDRQDVAAAFIHIADALAAVAIKRHSATNP